ncbi:MAG: hypothetical protein WC023_09875 [Rhodocyclaceae bacterium]
MINLEKAVNHEVHEVHEEKQYVKTVFTLTSGLITGTSSICLNFFVRFVV